MAANRERLTENLVRAMKCVDALGFREGVRTAASFLLNRNDSSKLLRIHVPGIKAPLILQGGSSHLPTFMQIMVNRHYDVDKFPQAKALRARFQHANEQGKKLPIIDCGANIGISSLWFAKEFPGAEIYAVEPSPTNFEMLRKNVAAYPNIVPLLGGVWDRKVDLAITNPQGSSWQFRVARRRQLRLTRPSVPSRSMTSWSLRGPRRR